MDKKAEEFKNKSLTGSKGTKSGKKQVRKIRYDRLIGTIGISAMAFIAGGKVVADTFNDHMLMVQESNRINDTIIEPNEFIVYPDEYTQRQEKGYNYKEIAKEIEKLGSDEINGVYFTNEILGNDYVGREYFSRTLEELGYTSYDEFIEKNGFANEKDMKKQILENLKANQEEKADESSYSESDNHSKGGK